MYLNLAVHLTNKTQQPNKQHHLWAITATSTFTWKQPDLDYLFILKVCPNKWLSLFFKEHLSLYCDSRSLEIIRVRIESSRAICFVKHLAKAPFFSITVPLQLEGGKQCNQLSAAWNNQKAEKSGRKDNSSCLGMQSHYWTHTTSLSGIPKRVRKVGLAEAPPLDRASHKNYRPESPCIFKRKRAAVVQSNKLFSVTTEYVCFGTEHNATSTSYMVINLFQ